MSTRIHYLSSLVLLCSAFPAQLFRVGLAMAGRGRPGASALRRVLGQLWLPGAFLLVAALVWYVAPSSGVTGLPVGWQWYAFAVLAGLAAPGLEVATGALVAALRRQRIDRIRLHERWAGGSLLAVVGVVLVAVAEEVVFRGVGLHLLVAELGWPVAVAVAVTAVVYGLNHLYFGPLTVLQKSVTGLLYGWLFLAAGHSVLVPVIAHVLQNLLVLLVLPRLGGSR